ncbi:hypothetical protein ABZ924_13615 [Streptomyces sp. NPDC046876]|uniref:hypothetical protein n=1 Tax=Streptomyces sp. NPDC046876 TaxID=3155616 RepID=UPI0033E78AFC
MTILVLAPPDDETARRFGRFAEGRGHRVVAPTGFGEVAVTVTADRNAAPRVELSTAGERIRAVFHRGLPPPEAPDGPSAAAEAAFAYAESIAVWWSVLALWPGPVVNRPSPAGFVPHLDPLTAAGLPGMAMPPSSITSAAPGPVPPLMPRAAPGERINVNRVRDGAFLGHGTAAKHGGEGGGEGEGKDEEEGDETEVLRFTCFDPERTRHVLLAGDEEFDLSDPTGAFAPGHRARLAPLLTRLRALGATFAVVVVQPEGERTRLLDISCHPVHRQFAHLEHRVFEAVLNALPAGPS